MAVTMWRLRVWMRHQSKATTQCELPRLANQVQVVPPLLLLLRGAVAMSTEHHRAAITLPSKKVSNTRYPATETTAPPSSSRRHASRYPSWRCLSAYDRTGRPHFRIMLHAVVGRYRGIQAGHGRSHAELGLRAVQRGNDPTGLHGLPAR